MRMLNKEQIADRAEKLLSSLILLHRSEGKRMKIQDFKKSLSHLPSHQRLYDALKSKKIITCTGTTKTHFTVQYCSEIHPNIEMTKKIVESISRVGERVKGPKKIVKNLPHTLYDKKEFKVAANETPQEAFTHQITALKESFEKQYGAKVEMMIEVTMTTTIEI